MVENIYSLTTLGIVMELNIHAGAKPRLSIQNFLNCKEHMSIQTRIKLEIKERPKVKIPINFGN